jgi:hypothetical protein
MVEPFTSKLHKFAPREKNARMRPDGPCLPVVTLRPVEQTRDHGEAPVFTGLYEGEESNLSRLRFSTG